MTLNTRNTLRANLIAATLLLICFSAFPQETQDKKAANKSSDNASGEQRVERIFPSTEDPTFTPVQLRAVSTPITLNQDGDTKTIYEQIGKVSGMTVLFDPDYASRPIHVDLRAVPLQEALQTVALASKTFWRPVTNTSIFVAQDTFAKRREIEQNVIKVFPLQGSSQTEFQDVANMMRTILDIARVQPMAPDNAIVVRGTPGQISLAGKLIDDLNRSRPKLANYRVEVSVAEMDGRTKLKSKSYRMFLQPNHGQKLNIAPAAQVAQENGSAAGQETAEKDKRLSALYQNIDCSILSESDSEVSLMFRGTFSDFSDAGTSPEKDVRQFSVDARPTLPFEKSTVIDSFDDPLTHHTMQVELTVTRLPET